MKRKRRSSFKAAIILSVYSEKQFSAMGGETTHLEPPVLCSTGKQYSTTRGYENADQAAHESYTDVSREYGVGKKSTRAHKQG